MLDVVGDLLGVPPAGTLAAVMDRLADTLAVELAHDDGFADRHLRRG